MDNRSDKIRSHFDRLAPVIDKWRKRNRYYHEQQTRYFNYLVGPDKRVLELGCGSGDLLNSLRPARGVGVDISSSMTDIARRKHPHLEFLTADAMQLSALPSEKFDYIVLSDVVGYLDDVQQCFEDLHRFCHSHTRILISHYNFLWEPLLRFAERMHLKTPTPEQSWLGFDDLRNILYLANYQVIKTDRRLLFPKYVPLLSSILNRVGDLPGFNTLCVSHYVIARPMPPAKPRDLSVSVVIPCRNEKGNIEDAVRRLPRLSAQDEIIFVDGHSVDGTPEEIARVIQSYPEKDIKFMVQTGTGKGDAVRKGFAAARGDVLMILDADLTVPPEDLPKFYHAIATNKAEFLNGSRLVYPMEGEAMRTLNRIGNKFFAMAFTWLLGERFKDTLCGTKVIFREDYERLVANRSYFGEFDPFGDFDLLFGASKLNLKIIEIPVRYRRRTYGETQIRRFAHGWLLLRMAAFAMRRIKWI